MGKPFDDAWRLLKMAAVMPDLTNPYYERMAGEFPLEALQYLIRNDPAMNLNLDEKGNFMGADYFGPTTEGLRQGQGTRMVTLDNGKQVEVPDVPPYVLANFDRPLSPETLEALRAAGITAHVKRLGRGDEREIGFAMLPNMTRQMVEDIAYRGAKDVPTDVREVTTNRQVGDVVYNHGQTFGDNPRMPAKGSMRFQNDNPLTEEEQQGVAVLNRIKSTEKSKQLGREEKTLEQIQAEQEETDRKRREQDAKERRELDERDKKRQYQTNFGRMDYEKNMGRSGNISPKKKRRNIGVYRPKKRDEDEDEDGVKQ